MKKIMLSVFLIAFVCSCNNEKKKTEKTETNDKVGVKNANGNIPDTTNAIDLTTHRDSATKKTDSTK